MNVFGEMVIDARFVRATVTLCADEGSVHVQIACMRSFCNICFEERRLEK